jgi:hypothetical protein
MDHIFLYLFKNKIVFGFVKFMATKKVRQLIFLPRLLLLLDPVFGSRMEKNQDPNPISWLNTLDSQHWV